MTADKEAVRDSAPWQLGYLWPVSGHLNAKDLPVAPPCCADELQQRLLRPRKQPTFDHVNCGQQASSSALIHCQSHHSPSVDSMTWSDV